MLVPSYDALGITDDLFVSAWFKANDVFGYTRLIARTGGFLDDGWEIETWNSNPQEINILGKNSLSENRVVHVKIPSILEDWVQLVLCIKGNELTLFANGISATNVTGFVARGDGFGLGLGCRPNGESNTFNGQYDEIRLRGGALSADRIKADYDMIKNRNFLRYGPVERGKGVSE